MWWDATAPGTDSRAWADCSYPCNREDGSPANRLTGTPPSSGQCSVLDSWTPGPASSPCRTMVGNTPAAPAPSLVSWPGLAFVDSASRSPSLSSARFKSTIVIGRPSTWTGEASRCCASAERSRSAGPVWVPSTRATDPANAPSPAPPVALTLDRSAPGSDARVGTASSPIPRIRSPPSSACSWGTPTSTPDELVRPSDPTRSSEATTSCPVPVWPGALSTSDSSPRTGPGLSDRREAFAPRS
jgi:hypothetical protein